MTETGSKLNCAYSTNNSTICFIHEQEIFVTPWTRKAMGAIKEAGLKREHFYVPFSNGDYPKGDQAKWRKLRKLAEKSYHHDYEEDCKKWCDEHKIGELSTETMQRCFKMPRKGVPVKRIYYKDRYYPICGDESVLDCTITEKLGHYCTNNGRVVFVYRDGHTYVTRGHWIIDELKFAGYKKSGLFVPFSNGEQITDSILAAQ